MSLHTQKQIVGLCNWVNKEKGSRKRQRWQKQRQTITSRTVRREAALSDVLKKDVRGRPCALHARVVRATFSRGSTLVLRPKQRRGRQSQSWSRGGLSDRVDGLRKGLGSVAWEQKLPKELPRTMKPGEQGYEIHQRGFLNMEKY